MVDAAMHPAQSRAEALARRTGWVALFAMALSVDLSTSGFNLAALALLLASIPVAGAIWRDVRRLPVFWLATALTVYVVVQSLVLAFVHPVMHESSNPHWSHVARVSGLFSLLVGWWMLQYRRHLPWLLLLVVLSLFVNRLLSIDYPVLFEGPFASRDLWGRVASRTGFASAAGVVISFAVLAFWVIGQRAEPQAWRPPTAHVVVTMLGLSGFLVALYGSQTRGAWLGALVACSLVLVMRLGRAHGCFLRAVAGGGAFLVIALVFMLSLDPGNVLEKRIAGAGEAWNAILALDREALEGADPALGERVNMWVEGVAAVGERPWFGWGSGSKPVLAERSMLDFRSSTGHLHNIYLELAYGLGLVGLLGFVLVYGTLFRDFARAWRQRRVATGVALATAGFWLMTLVALLTDVGIGHSSTRALLIFMLAVVACGALVLHDPDRDVCGGKRPAASPG